MLRTITKSRLFVRLVQIQNYLDTITLDPVTTFTGSRKSEDEFLLNIDFYFLLPDFYKLVIQPVTEKSATPRILKFFVIMFLIK